MVKTFLESYWIATRTMGQRKNLEMKEEAVLKKMSFLGRRLYKLGVVEQIEAVSRLTFANALAFIHKDVLTRKGMEQDPDGAFEKLFQITQRIYELSHHGL